MSENEVANELEKWWVGAVEDRNRWNRGFVGPAIKQIVQLAGNWKNAPRGDPRKGYQVRMEKERT